MAAAWPWLAVAGLGALHGLNPACGWPAALAWGRPLRALLPIAGGHLASVALVAAAVALGVAGGRSTLQALGVAALVVLVVRPLRRPGRPSRARAGAGLALWSFVAATAHGAGLMLVPALAPLCLAGTPAREITASGSLPLALAAVGVHLAAMLAAAGLAARAAARMTQAWRRRHNRAMTSDYTPIGCDLHDGLETLATARRSVLVRWRDAQGEAREREAVVTDVYSRQGAEYLVLSTGETLRLDQVSEVGELRLPDASRDARGGSDAGS